MTEGLLRTLTREELHAVLAHELARVRNRDIVISSVVALLAGPGTALAGAHSRKRGRVVVTRSLMVNRAEAWRKRVAALYDSVPRPLRRVSVLLLGGTIVTAGLVMVVLPGPGLFVLAAGVTVLALEFRWAERLLERGRRTSQRLLRHLRRIRPAVLPDSEQTAGHDGGREERSPHTRSSGSG